MSVTPEQRAARSALLRARKHLRDAMADVAIMDECTQPYRDALAAAEAAAELARDEYERLHTPASSGIARTEDMTQKETTPQPMHAEGQQWRRKTSGAVITLGHCTKATVMYADGTRSMRVSTLVRDYVKIK